MAISVDWPNGVVFIPKADMPLVGTDPISGREIRELDTDQFHEDLRSQEETVDGRAWPLTHQWNAVSDLSGDLYAPQLKMVNNYQVEFEEDVVAYRVKFTNSNNNIASFSVVNNVSIQPGNSAGLQKVETPTTTLDQTAAADLEFLRKHSQNKFTTDPTTGKAVLHDDAGDPEYEADIFENIGETQPYRGQGIESRGKLVKL